MLNATEMVKILFSNKETIYNTIKSIVINESDFFKIQKKLESMGKATQKAHRQKLEEIDFFQLAIYYCLEFNDLEF